MKEVIEDAVDVDDFANKLEEREANVERKMSEAKFNEEYFLAGRPNWVCELYFSLDKFLMGLRGTRKLYLESYIKYVNSNGVLFAHIVIRKGECLRLWVKIPYEELGSVPLFIRDYSDTNRRPGVMCTFDDQRFFEENRSAMLNAVFGILEKALAKLGSKKKRKTPLEARVSPISEVISARRPDIVVQGADKFKLNLVVGTDGFCEVSIRVHKSSVPELLSKLL